MSGTVMFCSSLSGNAALINKRFGGGSRSSSRTTALSRQTSAVIIFAALYLRLKKGSSSWEGNQQKKACAIADILKPEKLIHALRNFPEEVMDADTLLPVAYSIKISKQLEELRLEYEKINGKSVQATPSSGKEKQLSEKQDVQDGEVIQSAEANVKPKRPLLYRFGSQARRESIKQNGETIKTPRAGNGETVKTPRAGSSQQNQLGRRFSHSYVKLRHDKLDGKLFQLTEPGEKLETQTLERRDSHLMAKQITK